MRSLFPLALLLGSIGLSACGSSEGSPSGASVASPTSPSRPSSDVAGQPRVVTTARGKPEIEPKRLEFIGLEGHPFALARISWATWGGDKATGNAMLQAVKCDPECADGSYEDQFTVHVVLRRLDSECGAAAYRKLFVFRSGEGQYFLIPCPTSVRRTAALLKKDFGVSGLCLRLGHRRAFECNADGMRMSVSVARSGESVTITSCELAVRRKPNEATSCALRRLRG
jgi:hypothetical protein